MAFRAAAYQKRLEEAGFDPKMAHAQAAAIEEFVVSEFLTREYFDGKLSELRTELRAEMAELRTELRAEIKSESAALRAEFKTDLAALQVQLIRWMVGTVGGAALAIILTMLRVIK